MMLGWDRSIIAVAMMFEEIIFTMLKNNSGSRIGLIPLLRGR